MVSYRGVDVEQQIKQIMREWAALDRRISELRANYEALAHLFFNGNDANDFTSLATCVRDLPPDLRKELLHLIKSYIDVKVTQQNELHKQIVQVAKQ